MEELFYKVFDRKASAKEVIILRRLRKLYSEEIVCEAIRLSVVVTEGSPINYISAVANNLYKDTDEYNNLFDVTQRRLKDLQKYGLS